MIINKVIFWAIMYLASLFITLKASYRLGVFMLPMIIFNGISVLTLLCYLICLDFEK